VQHCRHTAGQGPSRNRPTAGSAECPVFVCFPARLPESSPRPPAITKARFPRACVLTILSPQVCFLAAHCHCHCHCHCTTPALNLPQSPILLPSPAPLRCTFASTAQDVGIQALVLKQPGAPLCAVLPCERVNQVTRAPDKSGDLIINLGRGHPSFFKSLDCCSRQEISFANRLPITIVYRHRHRRVVCLPKSSTCNFGPSFLPLPPPLSPPPLS